MLGTIAAVLTTIAFLPGALKAVVKRDVTGVNLPMYVMLTTGVGLWMVYGIMTRQPSLLIANGITFVFDVLTLGVKVQKDVLPKLGASRATSSQKALA